MSEGGRILALCREVSASFPGRDREDTARLLFGTACHEGLLTHRRQMGFRLYPASSRGAFSLWQMEWATLRDVLERWLPQRPMTLATASKFVGEGEDYFAVSNKDRLLFALQEPFGDRLGALLARLNYMRVPAAIPHGVEQQAAYWKRYWNTPAGKGTVEQYRENWERLAEPVLRLESRTAGDE